MALAPQNQSPNLVPAKNTRAASLSLSALAARLAIVEKRQWPNTPQTVPPFTLLGQSSQAGLAINVVVQGGGGGGGGTPPPSGSGADPTLTYITEADESGNLPNSRRLVAGTNITLVDGGAGSTLTINALAAGFAFTVTNTAVTPYTVVATDVAIGASASAGADQIINLPAATGSGRVIVITKMDANAHNIVVTAAGADKINGASTSTITLQYDTIRLYDNAAAVWVIW